MQRIAEGRTAEVFSWSPTLVLKLDRPEWNGLADLEADLLARLADTALPVPRFHEVIDVDGRRGQLIERIDGPQLSAVLAEAGPSARPALVARFCALQAEIAATHVTGMPDLVTMRADEVGRSGLPTGAVAELSAALAGLDDGTRSLCHFDLHPRNILVQGDRWVVIDWLTAASGPAIADVARTVLICGGGDPTERAFGSAVERRYHEEREAAASEIAAWVRVLAAARLSEGFTGAAADRLRTVALGGSVGR